MRGINDIIIIGPDCTPDIAKKQERIKAPKTPPPHGFWGFAAIEEGAEKDGFQGAGSGGETV